MTGRHTNIKVADPSKIDLPSRRGQIVVYLEVSSFRSWDLEDYGSEWLETVQECSTLEIMQEYIILLSEVYRI